jgi:hypothetical protein
MKRQQAGLPDPPLPGAVTVTVNDVSEMHVPGAGPYGQTPVTFTTLLPGAVPVTVKVTCVCPVASTLESLVVSAPAVAHWWGATPMTPEVWDSAETLLGPDDSGSSPPIVTVTVADSPTLRETFDALGVSVEPTTMAPVCSEMKKSFVQVSV